MFPYWALTERRYRRNRCIPFYRQPVRTASAFPRLPRRFAPRNDTSGGCGGAPELSSGLMPLCKALTDRRYRRNWCVPFYRRPVRTASAFPRLPRRFAPRNDTSGGCGGAPELSSGLMPLCKAVTDRRYRRNWSVRFIDALYELQVPSRDCHVALLLAMTRQAGAAVHQRPHAVECSPTGRSLSAATDAIGPCVLSTPCTDCKCVAGHGCPLPCKGVCGPCNFFSFPLLHSVI